MPAISRAIAAGLGLAFAGISLAGAAQTALPPPVEEAELVKDAFSTGTATRGEGALASDLWRGADPERLERLLSLAPARLAGPTIGAVLRRVLLTSGEAPDGAGPTLGGRKLLALARAGFGEEARTIASLSSAPENNPLVAEALAVVDLHDGALDEACARNASLASGRDDDFWMKLRVICYAAANERDAADLTLTLLREKGALSDADSALLLAVATGVSPKTPIAPKTALHLAALRQIGLPLAPGLLGSAEAGVLKAIARDPSFDAATRIAAANGAAAMGVVTRGDLVGFYESFNVEMTEIAAAGERLRDKPNDPMTDVIVFQSVRQMTAPEFLRDKAARIADALSVSDGFARNYALSLLYADEIEAMEGALLSPREAAAFAAARMAIGDGDGAARWLFAMLGSGGTANLAEAEAMEMIELVNNLSVLDPISAAAVAEAANIAVSDKPPFAAEVGADGDADSARIQIIESAFDAAIAGIPGQAALAALAMSGAADFGDPVARVVIDQSLRAAELNDLRRRIGFEAVWRARFETAAPDAAEAAIAGGAGEAAGEQEDEGGLTPRVKPRSSG